MIQEKLPKKMPPYLAIIRDGFFKYIKEIIFRENQ